MLTVRRTRRAPALAALLLLGVGAGAGAQTTHHVDAAAPPGGDGSRAAPYDTIQEGLDATVAGDVVLVAPGEYVESVVTPTHTFDLRSAGGPLVTTLRAPAGPFPVALSIPSTPVNGVAHVDGFTIRDSYYGIFDDSLSSHVERCIVVGNTIGVRSAGVWLERCTVAGNGSGIQDSTLGVVATRSIVDQNDAWDYHNQTLHALGLFNDCVGLQKVLDSTGSSFSGVFFGDAGLWDVAAGDVHLAPGSPCIGYVDGEDVGALDSDASYGAVYVDLGAGLAGRAGTPSLSGDGILYPGQPVSLTIAGGAPSALAWLVVGSGALSAPLLGGSLVPTPDVLVPAPLDAAGGLQAGVVWPDGLPPGLTLYAQAWIPDGGGPEGYAATNGLSFTAP